VLVDGMQEVREFDSPRLHSPDQGFRTGSPAGAVVRTGLVRDPCAKDSGHGRSRPVAGGAEQSLHAFRRSGDDGPDPVAVVPVDRLGIVAEQVGDLLDRGPGVDEQ
jgi:hypothetical protein